MRSLLTVCIALLVIMGIVSGNLWIELRSARQQITELQDKPAPARASVASPAQVLPAPPSTIQPQPLPQTQPQPTIQASAAPSAAVQQPPRPVLIPSQAPRPQLPPPPPGPVVSASVAMPLTTGTPQERRENALRQSDRTATARVQAWSTVLGLKPEQLQALNSVTAAELRRETEESLQIDNITGPMDPQAAARMKVETVTRQHATLVRIADKMEPQLAPDQNLAMRAMFDRWLATNMGRARAEEQAALGGY